MPRPRTAAQPLWDLIEESLAEAAFLWKRWESELHSLTRNVEEIWSWTEDRLHGALDGVRVAGEDIERVLRPLLDGEDLSQLTVCAHLLAAQSPASARSLLSEMLASASGPRLWSLVRGVEVAALDGSFTIVSSALASGSPEQSAALCRLKAFRRSPPARELSDAFESGVPVLQVEALRAISYTADGGFDRYVEIALVSDDPTVRRAAIECGVRRRLPRAWAEVASLVGERRPECGPLLPLLAMLGDADNHRSVIAALREPALQWYGVYALGYVGTVEAAEICLVGMRDPKLARVAAEAYCTITGADLERDRLVAPEPPEPESLPPLAEDVSAADLVPKAPDLWPLPDCDAVSGHWSGAKSRLTPGARHFRGRPFDLSVLLEAIETGPMMRRPDLILEATVRTNGAYDVEPRAFARVQQRMMTAGRASLMSRNSS
jgi:uncharacterized protein (TIGR02270 family)